MRLYDQIRREGFRWPDLRGMGRAIPPDFTSCVEMGKEFLDVLPKTTPMVIDELMPLAMKDDGLGDMSKLILDENASIYPAHDDLWVECQVGLDDPSILHRFDAVGLYLSTRTEKEIASYRNIDSAALALRNSAPKSLLGHAAYETVGLICARLHPRHYFRDPITGRMANQHVAMAIGTINFAMDRNGALLSDGGDRDSVYIRARDFACWYGFPLELADGATTGDVDPLLVGEELIRLVLPHIYAMAILHCKNVSLDDDPNPPTMSRQQRRREEQQGLPPRARYKILHVKVPGEKTPRPLASFAGPKGEIPWHSYRAHTKTYTPDRPLFGKYAGIFFIPPGWRGNPNKGIVKKQYELEPARERTMEIPSDILETTDFVTHGRG